MLYIRGHKIIKGYIGNTPISHVGFGKSGLIKIKSENGGSDYPNKLIAKYIFDATANADALPTFNSGYEYTVEDTQYIATFDSHNNVLPYCSIEPQYHSPIIHPNGTLIYVDSSWDWYSLDVTEYVNKQVTVSFDVSCVNDEESWRHCDGWITGYNYNIAEGVKAGSEPKHISYTSTLWSDTFTMQGSGIKLTNIQIMIDGVNLFDILPGFNEYFTRDDYSPNYKYNTACKVNNELWFTYSPWCLIAYDISTLSGCDITVSFDIDKFDSNTDLWIQFDHYTKNIDTAKKEGMFLIGDMHSNFTDTMHVEKTFTLEPGFNGYYCLEGMNGIISNFKIEVQSTYTTRSIYSDTLPTSILFNNESTKTSCVSVEYLDISNIITMNNMFNGCSKLTQLDLSNWDTSNVTNMTSMFNDCTNLTSISMNNSDYNSVNKVIAVLPTRTTDSQGTLDIAGIDDISQVDVTTAESKHWNIINQYKIAEYKLV